MELTLLRLTLPKEAKRAIDVLNYLKMMEGCYLNVYIAYKILLTTPVTIATAERRFSMLKLLKTYLWSTMSQERLNDLAILSIEKKVVERLDYESLINTFASKTARRVIFKMLLLSRMFFCLIYVELHFHVLFFLFSFFFVIAQVVMFVHNVLCCSFVALVVGLK